MFYVYDKDKNKLALTFIFLAFAWYILMGGPALADNLGLAGIEGVREGIPSLGEMYSGFKTRIIQEPIEKISTATRAWLTGRIEYAITGKVEENQYEPLGVYLERVQSAEPRFYDDENVVIWGSVKGRTLDDPINIKVGCYVKDDDKKIYADVVEPDKKFSVFAMEEQDFACRFNKCLLEDNNECILNEGSNFIKTFADFNFETLGYLKVYFINRERRRAMVREGLDVFKQFDIRDTKPAPIYTNGPAEIGMETTGPLISVSDNYLVFPRFSLSIQNRAGWEGTIKQLRELVLFFPKGVELEIPINYDDEDGHPCNKKFKKYEKDNCEVDSCEKIVYGDCMGVCEGFDEEGAEYNSCERTCDDALAKCKKDCEGLFKEQDQEYTGYYLDLDDVKVRDEFKDFEKFKRFNCRINPIPSEVLENAPITTKFFRVKARYNYTVEKPVTVNIEKLPDEFRGDIIGSQASAVLTESGPVVTLYKDDERKGDTIVFGVGGVKKLDKLDNEITSIDFIESGYVIAYYEHEDYEGACRADVDYVPNLKDVGVTINDKITSLNVSKFEGAVLYEHGGEDDAFMGKSDYYGPESEVSNFDDRCADNDKGSSIKVAPGYMAMLYRNSGYKLSDLQPACADDASSCDTCKESNIECICADDDVLCVDGDVDYNFGGGGGEPGVIKDLDFDDVDDAELSSKRVKKFNDQPSSIKIIESDTTPIVTPVPIPEPIPLGSNIIRNPGFEEELKEEDWRIRGNIVRDVDTPEGSGSSVKIDQGSILASACYPIDEGTYKLSIWIKIVDEIIPLIEFQPSDKVDCTTHPSGIVELSELTSNIGDWSQRSEEFTISGDVRAISIFVASVQDQGNGKTFLDDIELVRIS
jgi:hypothetical protein